jgi:hypothetical protein
LVSIFNIVKEEYVDGRTGCIIQGKKRLSDSHSKVMEEGSNKEMQEGQQTEKGMAKGQSPFASTEKGCSATVVYFLYFFRE